MHTQRGGQHRGIPMRWMRCTQNKHIQRLLLNHLGQVQTLKAEYDAAEQNLREALAVRRELLGKESPEVAETLMELAVVFSEKGEYTAAELEACLRSRFEQVEMRGVNTSERVRAILESRSRRIRLIMRLDPLGLRDRLPRGLIEWLFARFAELVRTREPATDQEAFTTRDFPVGDAGDDCLDLLAICRNPS